MEQHEVHNLQGLQLTFTSVQGFVYFTPDLAPTPQGDSGHRFILEPHV